MDETPDISRRPLLVRTVDVRHDKIDSLSGQPLPALHVTRRAGHDGSRYDTSECHTKPH